MPAAIAWLRWLEPLAGHFSPEKEVRQRPYH
jgi:hypothetical protein